MNLNQLNEFYTKKVGMELKQERIINQIKLKLLRLLEQHTEHMLNSIQITTICKLYFHLYDRCLVRGCNADTLLHFCTFCVLQDDDIINILLPRKISQKRGIIKKLTNAYGSMWNLVLRINDIIPISPYTIISYSPATMIDQKLDSDYNRLLTIPDNIINNYISTYHTSK